MYLCARAFSPPVAPQTNLPTRSIATEPLWDYHLKTAVYKDVAPCVVLGWGFMFTVVAAASEKLYRWVLKRAEADIYDLRLILFDAFSAAVIA